MSAVYFIATHDITDPHRYEHEYVPAVTRTLAAAGGDVVVATGRARTIEGVAPNHTVVVRFPSEQAFRDWYDSEDYAAIRAIRSAATTNGSAVLADEFPAMPSTR